MLDTLSFKAKLAWGYAIICGLLAVQSVVTYTKIQTMSHVTTSILEDRLPKTELAHEITKNTLNNGRMVRNLLLVAPSEMDRAKEEIEANRAKNNEDLSVRFGRCPTEVANRTGIVILEVTQSETKIELGIMVDAVSEVLSIGASDIEPAPTFGSDVRNEFIAGVGKIGAQFVVLLDVNRVLSVAEMSTLVNQDA